MVFKKIIIQYLMILGAVVSCSVTGHRWKAGFDTLLNGTGGAQVSASFSSFECLGSFG